MILPRDFFNKNAVPPVQKLTWNKARIPYVIDESLCKFKRIDDLTMQS
jgi:hypothetical protein